MQNLINLGVIIILFDLLFKGKRFEIIILLLVALSISPLTYIVNYKLDFSYIILLFIFVYLLLRPWDFKLLISKLTFIVIFLVLFNPILSLISTWFASSGNTSRSILWMGIIGTFKNISYIFVFGALTYRSLDLLEHKNLNYSYHKISNLIITSLSIIMTLNLLFVVLQFFIPDLGMKIVTNWYSSESRITLRALSEDEAVFYRFYGLNYSPVALGRMALLSLSSALFGIIDYISKKENVGNLNKLLFLMLVSFLSGILSFSKLFILGTLCLIIIFFVYSLINIFKKFIFSRSKFYFDFKLFKVIFLIILLLVCFYILFLTAGTLGARTGLPFSYYYKTLLLNPLISISSRYTYISTPQDTKQLLNVISKNLLIGVGFTQEEEFIGDSDYLAALHNGGVILLLSIILIYIILLYITLKNRDFLFTGIFLITLLSGIALPTLYTPVSMGLIGVYLEYYSYRKILAKNQKEVITSFGE